MYKRLYEESIILIGPSIYPWENVTEELDELNKGENLYSRFSPFTND